jgi:hypothetical protein
MTTTQSSSLVKNPNTKKAIAVLKRYAKAEAALKALEAESKDATEQLKQAMIDAGVPKLVFDPELSGIEGYITLAERINYKADDISLVPAEYTKPTLDTDKVKAQHTLTDQLPVGVVETRTQYITKKIKLVE